MGPNEERLVSRDDWAKLWKWLEVAMDPRRGEGVRVLDNLYPD